MVKLSRQNRKAGNSIRMNTLTQTLRRRQAIVEYANGHGVSAAAQRYNVSRPTIYRWKKRYDGTLASLKDRSRRPHGHKKQHTEAELKIIQNMRRRNPNDGLVYMWVKLRQRGYTRSISGLYKAMIRMNDKRIKLPNPKSKSKPYEKMTYPGQRVQIDVKYVPKACLTDEATGVLKGFFQYTFIDEYSRFRILMAAKEQSTYESSKFIKLCIKRFPYAIECVQTDNGFEFTNRLNAVSKDRKTLFETTLEENGIKHKLIKPYTPRHNGKVERSHRKDNEYFYAAHSFYSFDDFTKQLATWERKYNNFPMRPLGWISPRQFLKSFGNL